MPTSPRPKATEAACRRTSALLFSHWSKLNSIACPLAGILALFQAGFQACNVAKKAIGQAPFDVGRTDRRTEPKSCFQADQKEFKTMCTILESSVLLRARGEFPDGLRVATEEFREGWNRMRSGGVKRLEKKVQTRGWNFVKIGDGGQRSGVGETSEAAIATALRLALRKVDAQCNAVEVHKIELTQYPWFCVARMYLRPFRIQQGAELPVLHAQRTTLCPSPATVLQRVAALPKAS